MVSKVLRQSKLASVVLIFGVSIMFTPGVTTAQESDGWEFRLTPYLWMLGLDGTTASMGNDVDVDASFSDILDLLNIALSANMELSKGKFFVVFDPMYAELETDFVGPGPVSGKVDIELVIADLNVGYSVDENFGIYAGVRYYDQDITLVPNLLPQISLGDSWTDYLLGFRVQGEISEKWSFAGKLDGAVGGDSDFALYLQAVVLRHIGTNKHLDLGWRYYDVDYESGSGVTRFKWDVAHSGPVIGFSWEF